MLECTYNEGKRRLVLAITGDLKSTGVPEAHRWLEEEWPEQSCRPLKQVYLDVRSARIIDSTGVNWIFLLVRACREIGLTLTVQLASPAAMRVFEFAGLDKLTTIKYRRRKQL